MRYRIITYGCQRNKSDSERIAALLENQGHKLALSMNEADLVVINMCSVRQSAVDRVFGQAKNLQKLKALPTGRQVRKILTGCILKKDREKFKEIFNEIWHNEEFVNTRPRYQSAFRAYVPIMTGCNNFCSYCAVPYTRGKETSRPSDEIVCEVQNLVNQSYKEIWLLGENVNSYRFGFSRLLKMLNDIPGNFWIRFTSSHPKDFSEALIKTMEKSEKITPYLNLPVQSGDNEILRKMNRPYTVAQYKTLVKKIKKAMPKICLSTDVIVGFPGETKKQFENTMKLFKELKFDMAYISQYSSRPGTASTKIEDDVPHQEKEKRDKTLTAVLRKTAQENNKKYVGEIVEVLPEARKDDFLVGKTRTHKTIKFRGPKELIGQFVQVKVIDALPWGLRGKLKN